MFRRWRCRLKKAAASRAIRVTVSCSRFLLVPCQRYTAVVPLGDVLSAGEIKGGYCGGVPPLPIPNREVKPACADGTAMQCGRVGGRPPFHDKVPAGRDSGGDLFFYSLFNMFVSYPNFTTYTDIFVV